MVRLEPCGRRRSAGEPADLSVDGQNFSGTAFELDGTDKSGPDFRHYCRQSELGNAIQETKSTCRTMTLSWQGSGRPLSPCRRNRARQRNPRQRLLVPAHGCDCSSDPFTQYAANPITGIHSFGQWQQFGVRFGGPIIKNKLFFFADYQATRESSGLDECGTVPTAEAAATCNPLTNGPAILQVLRSSQYMAAVWAWQAADSLRSNHGQYGAWNGPHGLCNNQIPILRFPGLRLQFLRCSQRHQRSVYNTMLVPGSGSYTPE